MWSHFWMEAAEGVLHQEADWMREPVISARPIGGADAAVELEYYPRDPEWIPEWMAAKIAAYREEGPGSARRPMLRLPSLRAMALVSESLA